MCGLSGMLLGELSFSRDFLLGIRLRVWAYVILFGRPFLRWGLEGACCDGWIKTVFGVAGGLRGEGRR